MKKFSKKVLILSILTTTLLSPSFGDVDQWVNISDTQNIDDTYTVEQIAQDKQNLKLLYEDINVLDLKLKNKEISKDKYQLLFNEKSKEYYTLFSRLEKYGLIKKRSKSDQIHVIELSEATEIEQQVFTLLSKINYIKIQMESIREKLDKNEITKEKYESLYTKYSKEYEELAKDLKSASVEPDLIATNITNIPKVEIVNGIIIDSSNKLLKDSLPKEKYDFIKKQLNELDEKLLNQYISKEDYESSVNNLFEKLVNSNLISIQSNVGYIELQPTKLQPASISKLYNSQNIKKSILMLEDLLSEGKITKEQYNKKINFYNAKSKEYSDK